MVMTLVFGISSLGLVNGQPHKSTSLGLVCQSAKDCDGAGCRGGKLYGSVTCQNCIGISNDALWRNPCPDCGKSRKVQKAVGKCQKCQGVGRLSFGPRFQVADADFPKEMNWKDAMDACSSLGGGWRLPTIEELTGMYELLHKKGKVNFQDYFYWSSSQAKPNDVWSLRFDGIYSDYHGLDIGLGVRAVRTLP